MCGLLESQWLRRGGSEARESWGLENAFEAGVRASGQKRCKLQTWPLMWEERKQ